MVRLSTSKYAAAVPDLFWFTSEVEALKTYCPVIHKTLKTNCDFETAIPHFSINTQVIIQNRSHWLAISDCQPIITSTGKMAASSRFTTVSEDDFALKCFFFSFFEIITCVFILKQLFASGSVIIGQYSSRLRLSEYSSIITSPSANNC